MVTLQEWQRAKEIVENHKEFKCCVCEWETICQYFINSWYCDKHYYQARTRDNMIKTMPEYMLQEALQGKQPDIWNHRKWLRVNEGLENAPTNINEEE